MIRSWHSLPARPSGSTLSGLAGLIHGFTFFIIVIEGGTLQVGLPFAVLVAVIGLVWGRQEIRQKPVLAFFVIAYLVATLFFLGWGMYWGGFPQFSQVGIIN